ncbi:MAG: ABC transporter ATP-binding protein, partial [Gammaproteobacteria bacterium]|nr:ABC transporter ATP-binding protein [Gammaproteobacteria bacterium]
MSDVYFDDENYSDGFDDNAFEHGMKLDLWRRLAGYALNYRLEVSILAVSAFLTAIAEIAFPLITRSVIDDVAKYGVETDLAYYGALYGLFTVMLGLSVTGFIWFGGKIRTHVAHDIRMDGFCNLQRLSFNYYDYRPVGWLMARMTSDCERLSNILAWGMLDLIWGGTMMIGIAISMLVMDISLGLTVLSVLPVLAWISLKFQHRILKSARLVRKTNSRITGSYNESIMGVQTSKAFVKEAENLKKFGGLTDQMHGASVTNLVQAALYLPIVLTLGSIAIGLALVFGGLEVIWGAVTVGTLVAFLTYARHFFEPIEQLAHWFAEMQMAQASAERIMSLVMAEPDIQDSKDVVAAMKRDKGANTAIDGKRDAIHEIQVNDVSFKYSVGDPVLKNVNLTIQQGETLAIVGST